jgi:BetR domain
MEASQLQQQFFTHLKSILPSHISVVDELTELLNLSYDSVYRRIRGEKPLALNELRQICDRYHISLDQVLQLENDTVVFKAPDINQNNVPFIDYLKGMLTQFKYFNSFEKRKMRYLCKDLPIWHFYLFPEIGAFKTFFWIKTIQSHPDYSQKSFSLSEFLFEDCFAVGQEIIKEYNKIPCVELWNVESVNSTISQIRFYRDAGIFKNDSDAETVIDSFERSLAHLQRQAEVGVKFMPGQSDVAYRAVLQLYINEVIIGSNTILTELNEKKLSFIPYNVFSYMLTSDQRFNESSFNAFNTLTSRSTLISGTGEKERNKFFRSIKERVESLKK